MTINVVLIAFLAIFFVSFANATEDIDEIVENNVREIVLKLRSLTGEKPLSRFDCPNCGLDENQKWNSWEEMRVRVTLIYDQPSYFSGFVEFVMPMQTTLFNYMSTTYTPDRNGVMLLVNRTEKVVRHNCRLLDLLKNVTAVYHTANATVSNYSNQVKGIYKICKKMIDNQIDILNQKEIPLSNQFKTQNKYSCIAETLRRTKPVLILQMSATNLLRSVRNSLPWTDRKPTAESLVKVGESYDMYYAALTFPTTFASTRNDVCA